MFAAITDQSYVISTLVAAVSFLFAALGKVALELIKRGDRAHEEIIEQWRLRLVDSEARAEEWRNLAIEEYRVAEEAVKMAKWRRRRWLS